MNLFWALVSRNIQTRYRRSILGPLWAMIGPILSMVVYTIISEVISIPSEGVPYVIFSYSCLLPWSFFTKTVNGVSSSMQSGAPIYRKMSVPKILFALVVVMEATFDLLISGLILAGMMVWFRVPVGWSLLWVPVLILLMAALAVPIGLFFAAFGTYKTDFLRINEYLLNYLLYATPIIYPLSSIPDKWRNLYVLNPLVGILEGFRSVLAKGAAVDIGLLGFSVIGILIAWAIAWPVFKYMSQFFSDVL